MYYLLIVEISRKQEGREKTARERGRTSTGIKR